MRRAPRDRWTLVDWLVIATVVCIVGWCAWQMLGTKAHADSLPTSGAVPAYAPQWPDTPPAPVVVAFWPLVASVPLDVARAAMGASAAAPKTSLIETGPATPLGPDASITFSGALAFRLFEFPDKWPLVGGKAAFGSALTVRKYVALGGDVALQRAAEDTTGLRVGACWWRAENRTNEWALYLRYKGLGW